MFDVIVIGGGPAGSQAARILAESGHKVLLLEREARGRTKCCAGALSGRALGYLDGIELPPHVELETVEIHSRGRKVSYRSPRPIAKFVVRSELDQILLEAAQKAGAQIHYNTPALNLKLSEDSVEVETPLGKIQGQYLLGADGATGITRRLGVDKPRRMAIGLEGELFLPPDRLHHYERKAIVDYGCIKTGYGWIFPKVDRLSVGIYTSNSEPLPLKKYLQRFLASQELPQPRSLIAHPIPGPSNQRLRVGRALLAGDAASLADPLSGEGIAYALASGQLAAQTIGSALKGQSLDSYEDLVEQQICSQLAIPNKLKKILYVSPRLAQAVLRRQEALIAQYFATIAGQQSYSELEEKLKRGFRQFRWLGRG
jgi:geranylgeranyl reductase family protein